MKGTRRNREKPGTDVSRWPDATDDEIQRAMELATVRQAEQIEG